MAPTTRLRRHRVPVAARQIAAEGMLRLDGLVTCSLDLTRSDLAALPRVELPGDFRCEEGWTAPGLRWAGIRVSDVVALGQPRIDARYVRISSGGFVVSLPLQESQAALLCDTLDGEPLTLEHGAPWRLLIPNAACFTSVKWVNRLELARERGRDSGERLAKARLARRSGQPT